MTTIRIMTYNIQRCRGMDGSIDPERTLRVIGDAAPDIVALQDLDPEEGEDHLQLLSERLGMQWYGIPKICGNAFLSYYPLRGVQQFDLGEGGCCLRADADIRSRRLHLFNLRLDTSLHTRSRQIDVLMGPDLLNHRSLSCPLVVLGDFGDLLWGPGNMNLSLGLRNARRPLWCSTYPSRFPRVGRDRAYLRGGVRVVDSSISRSHIARHASSHLPLILTVQIRDTLNYLRLEKPMRHGKMEIAPG